jgi:hypothetical protein
MLQSRLRCSLVSSRRGFVRSCARDRRVISRLHMAGNLHGKRLIFFDETIQVALTKLNRIGVDSLWICMISSALCCDIVGYWNVGFLESPNLGMGWRMPE